MLDIFITIIFISLINVLIILDKDKEFTPYRSLMDKGFFIYV